MRRPLSASASGMFGVIARASGSSSRHIACTPSASSSRAPLVETSTGSRTTSGSSSSLIAAATASTIAAVASMPIFVASIGQVAGDRFDLRRHEIGRQRRDRLDASRALHGHRGDRAGAVDAERGERLQVGLDAGAAARVAARQLSARYAYAKIRGHVSHLARRDDGQAADARFRVAEQARRRPVRDRADRRSRRRSACRCRSRRCRSRFSRWSCSSAPRRSGRGSAWRARCSISRWASPGCRCSPRRRCCRRAPRGCSARPAAT